MKKGRGRTSRIRRRKLCRSSPSRGVNESYKPEFIALKKWLKARKFEDTNLIPACFPGTGRGLMSKTSLQEGQVIISLPESCLLTTDTVIRSYLGAYIGGPSPLHSRYLQWCNRATLVCEFMANWEVGSSPDLSQKLQMKWDNEMAISLLFLPSLYLLEFSFNSEELLTLGKSYSCSPGPLFGALSEPAYEYSLGGGSAACLPPSSLLPLLPPPLRAVWVTDECFKGASGLNKHNNLVVLVVKAAFNEETRCYEIRTGSGCRRHEEVFICYGPHDSRRLLLEYGFVPCGNPHACVPVSQDVLVKYLPSTDKQMNKKISILKDHDFIENLTFGWDGPSWRLLTALKLLCLEAGEFPRWKKVLLGERISDTNEKTSLDVAQKICRYFTEEASAMLQKVCFYVSHMKDKEMALIHQLTLVETLWTEELKILRASAETLSGLQAA
uniref:SET domain containing 4 n=1 Tax=Myotis lucifugus TaxID=59463 RepID=G1Q311_MYOLU